MKHSNMLNVRIFITDNIFQRHTSPLKIKKINPHHYLIFPPTPFIINNIYLKLNLN